MNLGAHKSLVNRILEPFLHINVVCTATEYMNFFGLRLDRAAQPEMRALAEAMWRAYGESEPRLLHPGEWHLPFIDADALVHIDDYSFIAMGDDDFGEIGIKVSVARCARVSYESFETGRLSTVEEDLRLYDRLVGAHPLHASPAEHQATPDVIDSPFPLPTWTYPEEHGNFRGWRQYRKMLPGEAVAPLLEAH